MIPILTMPSPIGFEAAIANNSFILTSSALEALFQAPAVPGDAFEVIDFMSTDALIVALHILNLYQFKGGDGASYAKNRVQVELKSWITTVGYVSVSLSNILIIHCSTGLLQDNGLER